MKLVIVAPEKDSWPHIITDTHITLLKEVVPEMNIVLARGEREIHEIQDADIIAGSPRLLPEITETLKVKWIHSFSAGVDRLLNPYVTDSDAISISNSSGIHATPIAEHIVGLILIHTRKFAESIKRQENNEWDRSISRPTELRDKNILVVGMGAIGSEAARLLHAFGAHVNGVVRKKRETPEYVQQVFGASEIMDALPKADFVINCLPSGSETNEYFDKEKFTVMKDTAVIVNIGRGGTIEQNDLIHALKTKKLGGALLDVTTPEPLPADSPLWKMEQVVITPHHSGFSELYMDRAMEQFRRNLVAFVTKEPLPNQVDKSLGY